MDRSRTRLVGSMVLALVAGAGFVFACGGKSKPADNAGGAGASASVPPSSSAPFGSASGASSTSPSSSAPASASASASASPLSTILTTDPNELAKMYSAAAAAASAQMQTALGGDPIEAGLKANAAKRAPGMQPEGPLAKGTLQEGGHLAMLVTLQAGKCYAIVGFSPAVGGVKDLDLHLLAPPFYNILSGEDTTDDNTPVIGKAPNPMCPVIPVGIPYKVDIFAQKGAGPVGVQLYSKSK